MSAHTPGPWTFRVRPNYRDTGSNHYVVEAPEFVWPTGQKGSLIAWLAGGLGEAMHERDERLARLRDEKLEADARLIAAAPDLLEACRAALDEMQAQVASDCGWCNGEGGWDEHEDPPRMLPIEHTQYCPYRLVEAAIAKAEGK